MQANKQVSQQQSEQGPLKKAIRVLSIDGGGIRGVAVAEILSQIEAEFHPRKIHELFDVIVGTSTGGLLAVMLSVEIPPLPKDEPKDDKEKKKRERQRQIREELHLKADDKILSAAQARDLYKLKAKDIFHEDTGFFHKLLDKNFITEKVLHWFDTKYEKGENLKEIVKALYIKNGFEHAQTCTGVVVTERGFGMPLLLNSTNAKVQGCHNYHNTLSLAKLVRATSAAPTYFKAIHIHNPCIAKLENGKEKTQQELDREKELIAASSSLWDKEMIDHKFCQRETLFFEDGGVTCNNPSLKGFRYAKELLKLHGHNPFEYEFQIYSFGTGATEYDQLDPAHEIIKELEKKGGKVQSGYSDTFHRLVVNDPFDIERMSYKNHHKIQQRLKFFEKKTPGIKHKYFRLQFKVTKDDLKKLDDSSEGHINNLIKSAKICMSEETKGGNPVFKQMLDCLREDVKRPLDLKKVMPNIKPEDSKIFQCPLGLHTNKSDACELTSQEQ